jgi:hypothetical protein
MARIGWIWEDATDGTTMVMPINPNDGASPAYQKNLTKKTTSAGRTLIQEGAPSPQQFDFSGVLLTKAHYDFVLNLWRKRHPLRLTDDLGRTFTVYLESFTPHRKPSRAGYPWKHDYQATAVILEGLGAPPLIIDDQGGGFD